MLRKVTQKMKRDANLEEPSASTGVIFNFFCSVHDNFSPKCPGSCFCIFSLAPGPNANCEVRSVMGLLAGRQAEMDYAKENTRCVAPKYL